MVVYIGKQYLSNMFMHEVAACVSEYCSRQKRTQLFCKEKENDEGQLITEPVTYSPVPMIRAFGFGGPSCCIDVSPMLKLILLECYSKLNKLCVTARLLSHAFCKGGFISLRDKLETTLSSSSHLKLLVLFSLPAQ